MRTRPLRIRPIPAHRLAAAAALAVGLALPADATAQTVTGRIVDESSEAPVANAVVELVDTDSSRVDAVLSHDDGRYVLRLRSGGPFHLRVRRIGFRTRTVGPLTGEMVRRAVDVRLEVDAVRLPPMVATGAGRCQVDPARGEQTALLWEQVRKALEVTDLIVQERRLRFEAVRFRRQLAPDRLAVHAETLDVGMLDRPFASPDAEVLARDGFVQEEDAGAGRTYYMPDPPVTLSRVFLDQHCFDVAEQRGPGGRLVGLAFEPLPERKRADVAGVLWLDAATGELRYLDYEYVNLPEELDEPLAGGRAEFALLETGAWVVRRWRISMPILEETSGGFLGLGTSLRAAAILEEGGELLAAHTPEGRRIALVGAQVLEGRVRDADTGSPVAGAVVHLAGTGTTRSTGADGGFTFRGLTPGEYLVTFYHPLLDTLGTYPPARTVRLPAAEPALLMTPSRDEIMAQSCPEVRGDDRGTLGGRVVARDGEPAGDVLVWLDVPLRGRRRTIHARSDARGWFRFCGLPLDQPLTVGLDMAEAEGDALPVDATVGRGRFAYVELTLPGG